MHIGLEIEGRLKGVPTLMLTVEEYSSKMYERVTEPYGNMYITDLNNELDLEFINANRDPFKDPILSIERTKVDKQYKNINIIFYVDAPVWNLKTTDQIKMNDGRYVWMIPVESMVKTVPDDYKGDFYV